jgi:ATP-binding cassette subfamily A (ABC1) protein 3
VQGVSIFNYWLANFVFDYIKYLIFAVISIIILIGFQADTLSSGDPLNNVCIMFFLYGPSMLVFTYFMGSLFESYANAQVWVFLMYFISGSILTTLIFLLRMFESTVNAGKGLAYFFKLFPPYLFGGSIVDIANATSYAGANVAVNYYDWANNG